MGVLLTRFSWDFMGFVWECHVIFVNFCDFCWTVVGILLELNVFFLIELRVNGMEWNGISFDLAGFH